MNTSVLTTLLYLNILLYLSQFFFFLIEDEALVSLSLIPFLCFRVHSLR